MGRGKLVGGIRDTINGFLSRMRDGGGCVGCVLNSLDVLSRSTVLEVALGKLSPDGPDPLDITLKFALAVEHCGDIGAVGPVECHGAEIPSMNEAKEILGSPPPTAAVHVGVNALLVAQTSENVETFLLQRMNVLKELVSCIKEVTERSLFS